MLLGAIVIISFVWLIVGIRQYRLIGSWNKRYENYTRQKQEMDRSIASQYGEETIVTDNDSHDVAPLSLCYLRAKACLYDDVLSISI